MGIEQAREHLTRFGRGNDILESPESSATVELAAQTLGVEPSRIAKSLSFHSGRGTALLVVVAGDARVDNAKFRARFGLKASMLRPEEVVALVGHAVGGVCPFGVKPTTEVYLDESLRRFSTVFPACGSSNSSIKLTCAELEEIASPLAWVDVSRLAETVPSDA
jgi:prolyl-tRNA editing enzyme YbaK/EbsC (Cys-tRNA(Pro) deacylase)